MSKVDNKPKPKTKVIRKSKKIIENETISENVTLSIVESIEQIIEEPIENTI